MNRIRITGKKMRELRTKANLTQAELGELLGYTRDEIGRFETGTRKIPRTIQIILAHIDLTRLVDTTKKNL